MGFLGPFGPVRTHHRHLPQTILAWDISPKPEEAWSSRSVRAQDMKATIGGVAATISHEAPKGPIDRDLVPNRVPGQGNPTWAK